MKFFDTKHKRKSATITAVILILLLLLLFGLGMKYYDPPIEYGVAIANGDFGEGEPITTQNSQNVQKTEITEEQVKEQISETKTVQKKSPNQQEVSENYTEDKTSKEVADIKKTEKKQEPKELKKPENKSQKPKEVENKKPEKEPVKTPKKAVQKPKPRNLTEANKALKGLLNSSNSSENSNSKSEINQGTDKSSGAKKSEATNQGGNSKYTSKGAGGDYQLSGRKALYKAKIKPNCEKEGVVVVNIVVNNQGKVVQARGIGISCLKKAAESAAKKTKWNADSKAPKNQKGKIIYRFTLN